MNTVKVISLDSFKNTPCEDVLVIGDNVNVLKSTIGRISAALEISSESLELFDLAISKLAPGQDCGDSLSLFVKSGEFARKVILGVLPTACARHNSPARPHALSALVASNKCSTIILLPSSRNHIFAQVCAAARQFPSFIITKKSQSVDTNILAQNAKLTEIVVGFENNTCEDAELFSNLQYVCENIQLCQHLVDMPTNYLYVDTYVVECEKIHARLLLTESVTSKGDCKIEVIRGRDLEVRVCVVSIFQYACASFVYLDTWIRWYLGCRESQ